MKDYVGPGALLEFLWGGLILRPARYREAADEPAATRLCLAVAVLAGAATGLARAPDLDVIPAVGVVLHVIVTVSTVLLEAAIVWLGARAGLRPGVGFGVAVRPIALATAPRIPHALVALGSGLAAVEVIGTVWLLAAFVVGVEAALRRGWAVAVAVALGVGALRWLGSAAVQAL